VFGSSSREVTAVVNLPANTPARGWLVTPPTATDTSAATTPAVSRSRAFLTTSVKSLSFSSNSTASGTLLHWLALVCGIKGCTATPAASDSATVTAAAAAAVSASDSASATAVRSASHERH